MKSKRDWTPEEQARIDRRRNDPAWELATEEEMANTLENTPEEQEIRAEYARNETDVRDQEETLCQ